MINKSLKYHVATILLIALGTVAGCGTNNETMKSQPQGIAAMHCINLCASQKSSCDSSCSTTDCGCIAIYQKCSDTCSNNNLTGS